MSCSETVAAQHSLAGTSASDRGTSLPVQLLHRREARQSTGSLVALIVEVEFLPSDERSPYEYGEFHNPEHSQDHEAGVDGVMEEFSHWISLFTYFSASKSDALAT